MKDTLLKSSLIIPALGLFVLGGVATNSVFADTATTTADRSERQFFQQQDLTDEQKVAVEEAHELHKAGDREGARAVIEAAGIPFPERGNKPELTDEQKAVLEEAKTLRDAGDEEGAKALLEAADIKPPHHKHGKGSRFNMENLTDEQKVAVEEAHELHKAGDREGARAVIEAAGISLPEKLSAE